uniref:Uncharacterized protein n=1 Tax=candidate division WOR-3 bacterium TaxID=2052148 RepID=A0A7C6EBS3_UNCW3
MRVNKLNNLLNSLSLVKFDYQRGGDYLRNDFSLIHADLISANPSLPEQGVEQKVINNNLAYLSDERGNVFFNYFLTINVIPNNRRIWRHWVKDENASLLLCKDFKIGGKYVKNFIFRR